MRNDSSCDTIPTQVLESSMTSLSQGDPEPAGPSSVTVSRQHIDADSQSEGVDPTASSISSATVQIDSEDKMKSSEPVRGINRSSDDRKGKDLDKEGISKGPLFLSLLRPHLTLPLRTWVLKQAQTTIWSWFILLLRATPNPRGSGQIQVHREHLTSFQVLPTQNILKETCRLV